MPLYEHQITRKGPQQMSKVTKIVKEDIQLSEKWKEGYLVVFSYTYTTAGFTVNENADPDVVHMICCAVMSISDKCTDYYRHQEGNSMRI